MEYYTDRIYPNSTPQFRMFQKQDGTMEMQVRYLNDVMGYTGLWKPVKTEKEQLQNFGSNGN